MEQPLCELCLARGAIKPAEDVHHLDSFQNYEGNERLWKAYDPENLMSLCKECHAKLHKKGTTHGSEYPKMEEMSNSHENKCPEE